MGKKQVGETNRDHTHLSHASFRLLRPSPWSALASATEASASSPSASAPLADSPGLRLSPLNFRDWSLPRSCEST